MSAALTAAPNSTTAWPSSSCRRASSIGGAEMVVMAGDAMTASPRSPQGAHLVSARVHPRVGEWVMARPDLRAPLLERDAMLAALDEALAAGGRLVLVAGEAGVGKTVLLRRFCERHADR